LGAILGVPACLVGFFWLRENSRRKAAARAPYEQQVEWRARLLGALVDLVGRDTTRSRRIGKLPKRLGWDRARFYAHVSTWSSIT
jgi:hypothetical protein